MRSLFLLVSAVLFVSFTIADDIYTLTFRDADQGNVQLEKFRGKKMLFVVLPKNSNDTVITKAELYALQNKYDTTLVIIGVLAEELGIRKQDESSVKAFYAGRKPSFLLTESIKVKRGAGLAQHPLLKWLTNKEQNKHFDRDVLQSGYKFFVDEVGTLYAVMGPEIKLTNPVIERILGKKSKK